MKGSVLSFVCPGSSALGPKTLLHRTHSGLRSTVLTQGLVL